MRRTRNCERVKNWASPNRDFDRDSSDDRIYKDFFCRYRDGVPLRFEMEFDLAFRMPHDVFESLQNSTREANILFEEKRDATGNSGW